MKRRDRFQTLRDAIVACTRCPRLRTHCETVAREKRAMYRDHEYWGKPVPGFGDPRARMLIVGLAPAAHGANRTGRMFTGDRSGDFLFASLHRTGFANQAASVERGDGLGLRDAFITAAARCAPPANKPTRDELEACRPFMVRELALLTRLRAVVALGRIGHDTYLKLLRAGGERIVLAAFPFAHGAVHELPDGKRLYDSFHPSQQNTFTGRLKPADLDRVFRAVRRALGPVDGTSRRR